MIRDSGTVMRMIGFVAVAVSIFLILLGAASRAHALELKDRSYALAFPTPIGKPVERVATNFLPLNTHKQKFVWFELSPEKRFNASTDFNDFGCIIRLEEGRVYVRRQVVSNEMLGTVIATEIKGTTSEIDPRVGQACNDPIDFSKILYKPLSF